MQPTLVIGVGGTGKWIVHNLYRCFMENEGEIPNELRLLCFDLIDVENPNPSATFYYKGEERIQQYMTGAANESLCTFYGNWSPILEEIQQVKDGGPCRVPCIYEWLKPDDASLYLLEVEPEVREAAAKMRQASRVCFYGQFSTLQGLLQTNNVRGHAFIVSSIAGGTGCGSAIDFAILLNGIRQKVFPTDPGAYKTIGLFVLPESFGQVVDEDNIAQMNANAMAFIRECLRLSRARKALPIEYIPGSKFNISGYKLFDGMYFIDNQRNAGQKHNDGLVQLIADYLYYTITNEPPSNEADWLATYNRNILDATDPFLAQIGSALGMFRLRWESKEVAEAITLRLAKETLDRFLTGPGQEWGADEAQAFRTQRNGMPYERQLVTGAVEQKTIERSISKLERYMETAIDGIDTLKFPNCDLIELHKTKKLALPRDDKRDYLNKYIAKKLGNSEDLVPSEMRKATYYAVLEFYRDKNAKRFDELLREKIMNLLTKDGAEDSCGRQAIGKCITFLQSMEKTYVKFVELLTVASEAISPEHIEEARDAADREYKPNIRLVGSWLAKENAWFTLRRAKIVIDEYLLKMAQDRIKMLQNYLTAMTTWSTTFRQSQEYIRRCQENLRKVRQANHSKNCWSFVTEVFESSDQWDPYEHSLYQMVTEPPGDTITLFKQDIYENIHCPHFSMDDLGRCFSWTIEGDPLERPLVHCAFNGVSMDTRYVSLRNDLINPSSYELIAKIKKTAATDRLQDLSIFSILAWKKAIADELVGELMKGVGVQANYTPTARSLAYVDEKGKSQKGGVEWLIIYAPSVKEDRDGELLRTELMGKLEGKGISIREHAVQEIACCRAEHLISIAGFTHLADCQDDYRHSANSLADYYLEFARGSFNPAGNVPIHLFPNEKNAMVLEKLIGDDSNLPVAIIDALSGDFGDMTRFAYYYFLLDKIKCEIDPDKGTEQFVIQTNGSMVTLGRSLLEAFTNFVEPRLLLRAEMENIETAKAHLRQDDEVRALFTKLADPAKVRKTINEVIARIDSMIAETEGIEVDLLKAIRALLKQRAQLGRQKV